LYLTKWRFYSDLAVVHVEGLIAPWPNQEVSPRVSPPTWECTYARGDFLGANSCPQTSSHSLWERIYLPLVPCTWLPPGVTLLVSRNYPKGVSGRHGHFTSQIALHWRYYYGLEATLLFSILLPQVIGVWGLPTVSLPPWSFLPMGIGEQHCDCLAFVTFDLGDALAGRCLTLATPYLGDACTWRLLT